MVRIDRKQVHVEASGRVVPCTVRGRFFEGGDDDPESRPVAVGDDVEVEIEGETGAIEKVLPRRSRIARPKPRDPQTWQVIAANVDLMVIVVSMSQPDPRPGLIDRLLVAAESDSIEPVIVVNKIDLVEAGAVEAFAAPYRALGYRVLATSASDGRGLEELKSALLGKTAMFLGHSGVGKSSLLTALDPTIAARIGELIRTGSNAVRGAHTTTSASLHPLAFGAALIDTPGVREFGLPPMEPHDLAHWFRDLAPFLPSCRYSTCTHDHEPGCAVKAAAAAGQISPARFATYQKLLAELRGAGQRMQRHDSY